MKTKVSLLAVLLILILVGWVGYARAQKTNDERKVWEYKVRAEPLTGSSSAEDGLNQLGAEGWELVAVVNVSNATTFPSTVFYLKRAIR